MCLAVTYNELLKMLIGRDSVMGVEKNMSAEKRIIGITDSKVEAQKVSHYNFCNYLKYLICLHTLLQKQNFAGSKWRNLLEKEKYLKTFLEKF